MSVPNDDMEMEKIAEDELSKLQRQINEQQEMQEDETEENIDVKNDTGPSHDVAFHALETALKWFEKQTESDTYRVMEIDRATVMSSVQPTLRMQRNIIRTLTAELDKIMMELKLTNSTSNVLENAKTRERLITLLKEHERCSAEVREHRTNISELDFLLKQVQKEIKALKSKGSGFEKDYAYSATNQSMVVQLENRLDTAMKKFNTVNSDNYKMRLEIDCLVRDRQFFNTTWRNQIKRLMEGKAQILELVEQAIGTYEQREEWCAKLDALREKAALDYRKHCLEVRELQRQLEHSMKLEEFLRTKGTVRLTAADARAEARRLQHQEMEMRAYSRYANVLEAIKDYTGEQELERLTQEFTRREEENYALFNYVNELHAEMKSLADNVSSLRSAIDEERAKHEAKMYKQQDSVETLRSELQQRKLQVADAEAACTRSGESLDNLLRKVRGLAQLSDCDSLPLLKLLGKSFDINVTNARLYIKSLEKKIVEMLDIIKADEMLSRHAECRERATPARRARRAPPSPRPPRALPAHA